MTKSIKEPDAVLPTVIYAKASKALEGEVQDELEESQRTETEKCKLSEQECVKRAEALKKNELKRGGDKS